MRTLTNSDQLIQTAIIQLVAIGFVPPKAPILIEEGSVREHDAKPGAKMRRAHFIWDDADYNIIVDITAMTREVQLSNSERTSRILEWDAPRIQEWIINSINIKRQKFGLLPEHELQLHLTHGNIMFFLQRPFAGKER